MGTFLDIAADKQKDGSHKLMAIFKGCVIHIGVSDEQTLMRASSRFKRAHLNDSAVVPKDECWRAINAWARVEREISEGKKSYEDLPRAADFKGLWRYDIR